MEDIWGAWWYLLSSSQFAFMIGSRLYACMLLQLLYLIDCDGRRRCMLHAWRVDGAITTSWWKVEAVGWKLLWSCAAVGGKNEW